MRKWAWNNSTWGQKDIAIEHYEKFLDLWKDADPKIAEMEDARERLAGLRGPIGTILQALTSS